MERYSRHTLLPEVGIEGQQKLLASRVAVVGAGGLGSPCSLYLAAAGVGTLGIIDGDVVDLSNLQRQVLHYESDIGRPKTVSAKRTLLNINPDVCVIEHQEILSSANVMDILGDYDVVVNGCDNFPTRYLINDACVMLEKPLVDASILRFEGQATVFMPGKGCYRCLFPEPPPPGSVPSCAEGGIIGALAGIMGTLQAIETVKVLLGIGEPLSGRLLLYNALRGEHRYVNRRRDPDCPVCGDHPTITELIDYHQFCGLPQPGAEPAEAELSIPELAPEEAYGELQRRAEVQLVDVREPWEYEKGHLPGARLIPLGEVEQRAGELDPSRPVFAVCARGGRSMKAAQKLKARGFEVTNIAEGTMGWINAGLPIES
ncbi:MAG: molybdopterin-synthase adenylyltransferase MoeB [Armatimonadetes bacterium]|nr:molybdopterin-synthase adenylyltransferase MoeB [Armatimonadota bacterium]